MTDKQVIHLRKTLVGPLQPPRLPDNVELVAFDPKEHARATHTLLEKAYASGYGTVEPFDEWWVEVATDPEYDPDSIFTACDRSGLIAGIALCWSAPFVKDIAVARSWQRKGLGEALLRHAFVFYQQRGDAHIDLKVHSDNPALRLYRRLGMHVVY